MASISSIASSGLRAAQLQLDTSAHNVANLNTEGFRRQTVEQEAVPDQGGVEARAGRAAAAGASLEEDAVSQMSATYAFSANLQMVKTEDRMLGSLLDTKA
ncbi:flagellar basal body protein [Paracidovorax konjaci]|uniref:Flagellar basal body rod FlgEFG protein C-terminal n=1 Tax=Paracidovorax konjaci TaxID=32040 RepID=A0A1I1XGZ2_9BURK|nr:flagellar basal body protein [Paracidovorax konjaci]SFE06562.1 Flagellar basal body rod FlgEFG protein C-terminal [Paracidovorax konjaci]